MELKNAKLADILKDAYGITIEDIGNVAKSVTYKPECRRVLKFPRTPRDCYAMLLRCYVEQVQNRGRKFELDENTITILMDVVNALATNNPKPGLILCGLRGNGKSTLARAIRRLMGIFDSNKEFKYMGDYFRFESLMMTATEISDVFKREDLQAIQRIKDIPFLIIDDLGEEPKEVLIYGTPACPLRELLEHRYDTMDFTILTTNLAPKDWPEHYGWRVVDRLRETYMRITHKGGSYRKETDDG